MKQFIAILMIICLFYSNVLRALADVGTATSYDPPYLPTRCRNYNSGEQFPQGGYFAAASDGLWDSGAACGRRYSMRCISGPNRPCNRGSIVVEVVDLCRSSPCPSTMVLSHKAFRAVSRNSDTRINIEFVQI